MEQRTKKIIIITGGAVLLLFVLLGFFLGGRDAVGGTTITTQVVPSASTITIDGKKVKEGRTVVTPGKHTVGFSYTGFSSASRVVTVPENQDIFVGEILLPNTKETENWYKEHPEEEQKAEGISSNDYDQLVETVTQKYPIINDLPVVEGTFRIDYGDSRKDPANVEAVGIYIRAIDQQGRDDALNWIRTFGYNPDDYELIYINPNEE